MTRSPDDPNHHAVCLPSLTLNQLGDWPSWRFRCPARKRRARNARNQLARQFPHRAWLELVGAAPHLEERSASYVCPHRWTVSQVI